MRRREVLETGEIYHVFSKSIANYKIFNNKRDYERMRQLFKFFQQDNLGFKYSMFLQLNEVKRTGFDKCWAPLCEENDKIVQIISYCLMPTHFHLLLKQVKKDGISR